MYPDVLLLAILWLTVFVPLTYRGAEYGFRRGIAPFPVETSIEARDISKERDFRRRYVIPLVNFLVSGVLVLGVFYVENYFLVQCFISGGVLTPMVT